MKYLVTLGVVAMMVVLGCTKEPTKAVHWVKMAYNKLYWVSARGLL